MIDFLNNHTPLLYLTQPLWRDEAYSVLLSQHSIIEIIKLTAQDFNPPLYYLLLHFWMEIFGYSEISVRMLSFLFHLLLVFVCYKFAKKLNFSRFIIYHLSFIIFLNPMLLYYGFEARMYSLLALLATASMYFFYTKKWRLYVLVSALGLYTQPFMVFVILSQFLYWLITDILNYSSSEVRSSNRSSRPSASNNKGFFVSLFFVFLLFSPWIPTLLSQFSHSSSSWIWPINLTTITSILGNLFTGYEGTPDGLWGLMGIISIMILIPSFWLVQNRILKQVQNDKIINFIKLLFCWIFLPVILVLTISVFKPVYVNRYLIFVTVAEIFLIVLAVSLVKNKIIQRLFYLLSFIFYLLFNLWFAPFHRKTDFKTTIAEIKKISRPNDIILSKTPLSFFETVYYVKGEMPVFLYNPQRITVPAYVGSNLIPERTWKTNFPKYPNRAFLIYDNAEFISVSQK